MVETKAFLYLWHHFFTVKKKNGQIGTSVVLFHNRIIHLVQAKLRLVFYKVLIHLNPSLTLITMQPQVEF